MPDMLNYILTQLRKFNPLYIAISLSLLMLAAIIAINGTTVYNGDSFTYMSAWDDYLSKGHLDIFRTPVYPYVIGIGKMLLGEDYWPYFPTILQALVFYSCGIVFAKMIFRFVSNRYAAWAAVFLYFLFYPIVNMIVVVGTESLAFSLVALWLYCVWQFMERPRWSYGIYVSLITLTSAMLRPSLLILAIAIVGLAIAGSFFKHYRRNVLLMLLTLIPLAAAYVPYVNGIYRLTGLRTISTVAAVNKYYMARQYDAIFPELLPDNPLAVKMMQRYNQRDDLSKLWAEITQFENTGIMTNKQMDDYATAFKEQHPDLWYSYIATRIYDSIFVEKTIKGIANYLIVFFYTIAFAVMWIKRRVFSLHNFLILMIGGGSLLSLFLYAQNDFCRLMLPTSAALIIMGGQLLSCIKRHPWKIKLQGLLPLPGK